MKKILGKIGEVFLIVFLGIFILIISIIQRFKRTEKEKKYQEHLDRNPELINSWFPFLIEEEKK